MYIIVCKRHLNKTNNPCETRQNDSAHDYKYYCYSELSEENKKK